MTNICQQCLVRETSKFWNSPYCDECITWRFELFKIEPKYKEKEEWEMNKAETILILIFLVTLAHINGILITLLIIEIIKW